MNKGIIGAAVGVIIVAVVAVGAYFLFFAGGPGGTGGGTSGLPAGMTAQQAADKVVAGAAKSGRTMSYGSAKEEGGALVMKDVTVAVPNTPQKLKIGEIRLKRYDYSNPDLPAYADLEYKNLSLGPLLTTPEAKQFMQIAGIDDVVVDVKASYTYDATNKVLEVKDVVVDAHKLATIKMSLKLGGIDLAAMQAAQKDGKADPTALLGMMQTLQIYGITLAVSDHGLRDAIMKSAAARQKSDVEKVKAMALAGIAMAKGMPHAKAALVQEALAAAEHFVKDGGTITLKIAPDAAVAVMSLAPTFMGGPTPEKLDALKKQLNLTISHN